MQNTGSFVLWISQNQEWKYKQNPLFLSKLIPNRLNAHFFLFHWFAFNQINGRLFISIIISCHVSRKFIATPKNTITQSYDDLLNKSRETFILFLYQVLVKMWWKSSWHYLVVFLFRILFSPWQQNSMTLHFYLIRFFKILRYQLRLDEN